MRLCLCETTHALKSYIIIDHVALAKQEDNGLGSVCLSVCLSVCAHLGLLRLQYTPLQRYMGYLCTMVHKGDYVF